MRFKKQLWLSVLCLSFTAVFFENCARYSTDPKDSTDDYFTLLSTKSPSTAAFTIDGIGSYNLVQTPGYWSSIDKPCTISQAYGVTKLNIKVSDSATYYSMNQRMLGIDIKNYKEAQEDYNLDYSSANSLGQDTLYLHLSSSESYSTHSPVSAYLSNPGAPGSQCSVNIVRTDNHFSGKFSCSSLHPNLYSLSTRNSFNAQGTFECYLD